MTVLKLVTSDHPVPLRRVPSTALRPAAPVPPRARLGFFAALSALQANPITAFAEQAYEADVLLVRRLTGLVLVNEPQAVLRILVGNADNYAKSRQQQRRLQPGLGEGLLTAEGETWRAARRLTASLFTPKAVNQLFEDMRVAAQAMADRWQERTDAAAPLDLAAEFQRLTYEIVSQTVFSGDLDDVRLQIQANMAVYFDSIGRITLSNLFNLPTWLPTPTALRARPALRYFREVIERAVAARLKAPRAEGRDLLDRLIEAADPLTGKGMTGGQVSDNVRTFLAAGHETTANALCWILYLLALFPEAEERVVAEMAGNEGKSLDGLIFTRAVVNEALRLYPPAPFIGRQALGDDTLAGRPIAAGTQILIAPWILHRHRRFWRDPDDFVPERFLPPEVDAIERGTYLPFGLGPRICIGQGFAIQEILIVLTRILPAFHFRLLAPDKVLPKAHVTLVPEGGLPMIVTPRRPA